MREFWRQADAGERIFIVGASAIFVEFIAGFTYLYQLAAHLDYLDRISK